MAGNFSPLRPASFPTVSKATFVPMAPPAANADETAAPKSASASQPLLRQAAASGVGHAGADHKGPPQISVEKEGDRISLIRIQCSCGQVIEVACTY
jgi:hypothetical protein